VKRAEKAQNIDLIQKEFSRATVAILTDYRGLKTPEINVLRRKLQDANGDYKVVKNTLAIKAAEKLNRKDVTGAFTGPVAVALGYGDATQLAKAFADHVRTSRMTLPVKGGFLPDAVLTTEDISTLATLPPRPVLVARVIGGIKGPLYSLVGVLAAPMRDLQGVLQARIKQLEGSN